MFTGTSSSESSSQHRQDYQASSRREGSFIVRRGMHQGERRRRRRAREHTGAHTRHVAKARVRWFCGWFAAKNNFGSSPLIAFVFSGACYIFTAKESRVARGREVQTVVWRWTLGSSAAAWTQRSVTLLLHSLRNCTARPASAFYVRGSTCSRPCTTAVLSASSS